MKITNETKIGELVPEGYELSDKIPTKTIDDYGGIGPEGLHIFFRKKTVKDFNYYVKAYFTSNFPVEDLRDNAKNIYQSYLYTSRLDKVPFEVKIGLLKFICEDFGAKWINVIYPHTDPKSIETIHSVCPNGFIESLFK